MSDSPWRAIGVDWDSGSWLAVGYSDAGKPGANVYQEIATLWEEHGSTADRILIDVPIGLCQSRSANDGCVETEGELSRLCDDLARKIVGPQYRSVFTPPCWKAARKAVDNVAREAVSELNDGLTGKGLTQQAVSIAPGIVEVENLLLNDGDKTTVMESHPEVCFRAFLDEPLDHGKDTAPGMAARLHALEKATEYERGTWRNLATNLGERGYDTGPDDLLDALCLALTALAPADELRTLPMDPRTDSEGLPVQMVYRRSKPFDIESVP